MNILIFSDSHGDSSTMCKAVETEQPDMIIYLGDGIADAEKVRQRYPHIQMITTLGNVDSAREEEWIKYADICGKRIMMTHGHIFYKYEAMEDGTFGLTPSGMAKAQQRILKLMHENNIDITLHGHLHEPRLYYNSMAPSKGWIMCPGRIGRIANDTDSVKPMYGVLEIKESGALEWQFIEVEI